LVNGFINGRAAQGAGKFLFPDQIAQRIQFEFFDVLDVTLSRGWIGPE